MIYLEIFSLLTKTSILGIIIYKFELHYVWLGIATTFRLNYKKSFSSLITQMILYRYMRRNLYNLVLVVGGW